MKFPANGERTTPFLRIRPSCTGVMETFEAPTSTTKAVGFPEENLKIVRLNRNQRLA